MYTSRDALSHGSVNFYCKGPDSKYCRLGRPGGPHCDYSTLSL